MKCSQSIWDLTQPEYSGSYLARLFAVYKTEVVRANLARVFGASLARIFGAGLAKVFLGSWLSLSMLEKEGI